jgi:hypothetical protein
MKQLTSTTPSSTSASSNEEKAVSSSFLVKMSTIELIGAEILIIETPSAFSLSSSNSSSDYASRYHGITGIILGKSEENLYLYNTSYQPSSSSSGGSKKQNQRNQSISEEIEGTNAVDKEKRIEDEQAKDSNNHSVDDMMDEDGDDAVENDSESDNGKGKIEDAALIGQSSNLESNEGSQQVQKQKRKGKKLRSKSWLLQQPIIKVKKSKISFLIILPDLSSSTDPGGKSVIQEARVSNELSEKSKSSVSSSSFVAPIVRPFPSEKMKKVIRVHQKTRSQQNQNSSVDEKCSEQLRDEACMMNNQLLIFHPENKLCKK